MKTNRLISLLLCLCMVATLFTGFAETASADDYITYTVKSGDNLYSLVGKMGMNYGTVKYVIMALNGFTNEAQLSQLQPGQTIILPTSNQAAASLAAKTTTAAQTAAANTAAAAAATATTATNTTTATTTTAASTYYGYTPAYYLVQHQVQKGETLTSICKALGTNYYDYKSVILNLNKLANDSSLKVGQVLWVPAKVGSAGGTIAVIAYSVANGDSISSICAQYDTSYANYKDAVKAVNPKIKNLEKLNVGQTVYIPVYTSYNNAVAGNPSSAAGNEGAPAVTQATGYSINFTATDSKKFGNPYAIVGNQANVQRAQAGSTVIIRPNAYSGYAVTGVKVVRTDSNAHIAVNDYAFTMPNSNVQITIDYAAGKQIRKLNSPHGHFDTYVYGTAADSAFYGDEVEIVPYPDEGYEVASIDVFDATQAGEVKLVPTITSKDKKTNSFHFTMPNQHAKVKVTFKVSTKVKLLYNTFSPLYSGLFGGSGVVKFFVNGQEVTEADPGDKVTAVIIPADGWIITAEPVFLGDIDPLFPATLQAKKVAEYTYTFKVAEKPVAKGIWLFIQFTERVPYYLLSVNLTGSGNPGLISFTVTDALTGKVRQFAEYAYPGDTVKIVPYTTSGARWNTTGTTPVGELFDYEYNPTETVTHTTIAITGAVLDNYYWTDPGYEFTMPAAGVNVEPRFDSPALGGGIPEGVYNSDTTFYEYRKYLVTGSQSEYGTIEIYDGDPTKTGSKPIGTSAQGNIIWVKITPNTNYRLKRDYDSNTGKPWQYYLYFANPRVYGGYEQFELKNIKEDPTTSIIYASFMMPQNDTQVVAYYEMFYQNDSSKSGYDTVTIKAENWDNSIPHAVTDPFAGTRIMSDSVGNYNVQMWINGVHVKDGSEAVKGNVVVLRFELKDDRKLEKVLLVRHTIWDWDTVELLPNGDGYYWYLIDEQDVNSGVDYSTEKYPLTFRVYTSTVEKPKYTISHGGIYDSSHLVDLSTLGSGVCYEISNLNTTDYVDTMGVLEASEGDEIFIWIPSLETYGYGLDQVNVKGIDNFTMGDLTWDSSSSGWYYKFIMPPTNLVTEVLYKEYQNKTAEMMDP